MEMNDALQKRYWRAVRCPPDKCTTHIEGNATNYTVHFEHEPSEGVWPWKGRIVVRDNRIVETYCTCPDRSLGWDETAPIERVPRDSETGLLWCKHMFRAYFNVFSMP